MFAANPERPPQLHLADKPRHTTANPWRCAVARPAHSAVQIPLARAQAFRKILARVRTYQMKMNFRVARRQFLRRATVSELTAAHRASGWLVTLEEILLPTPSRFETHSAGDRHRVA